MAKFCLPIQIGVGLALSDAGRSLSEQQKACLRLVARGRSSKEIAQATGLSPSTVDTYLKGAIASLEASNRRDAARRFELLETSQKSGSQPPGLGADVGPGQSLAVAAASGWGSLLAPPPIGGRRNDLTAAERTFAVMRVAAIGLIVVVALALVIAGVFRAFR